MDLEMNEIWSVYRDDIIPLNRYEVITISQSCEGTKIVLESATDSLEILFWAVDSLRATDEGRRLRTYNEVISIQEYRKNFNGVPLFTVDNSEFGNWISKESAGIYTDSTHYAIMTRDDIVAPFPPEIILKKISTFFGSRKSLGLSN